MRRLFLVSLVAASTLVLTPIPALADSDTHTYQLHMEGPNFGEAAFRHATIDGKPLDSYPVSSINSVNTLQQAETQNGPLRGGAFSVRYARE